MKTKIFQNIINDCLRRNNIIGDYLADETKLLADAIEKVIDETEKAILGKRRYLPNKESIGIMDYWIGDDNKNRGIYVDLGGVMKELEELKTKLSELKI